MRKYLKFASAVAMLFVIGSTAVMAADKAFNCEKAYPAHLQGFDCTDEYIFWSFSNMLVKTDWQGRELAAVPVKYHHGDLCFYNDKIYVAVNYGKFNDSDGKADNYVLVYSAGDLKLLETYPVPEVTHGAGAIARTENGFLVTGGLPSLPEKFPANLIYEYDENFKFIRSYQAFPWTLNGVQTICSFRGGWLLGCHRGRLIFFDGEFKFIVDEPLDSTHGIMVKPETGKLWRAFSSRNSEGLWQARVFPVNDRSFVLPVKKK